LIHYRRMRRAAAASLLAALLLVPSAAAAVPFKVSVTFSKRAPHAGKRWEYAVLVTDRQGNRIEANVFPQVVVDGREFDSLGSHYTILGIVDEPYTWSKQLRGRSGVVFRITVFAAAKKLVLRYRMNVR
jgi:hypothetical protein